MSRPRVFDYIEAVVRTRSIRKAAEILNVSSSSVNRMIMEYERELGTLLFERHARGVRLTTAGEYLTAHIRRTAQDFDAIRTQIDALRSVERGRVTIATVEAASGFLAAELGRFHMSHRLVSHEIELAGSANVVAAVEQQRVDIGLALDQGSSRQLSVIARSRYSFHAFMGKDHPLAARNELKLSECVGFPLALGDSSSGGRVALDRAFETLLLESRPAFTSNSFTMMIELTRHTDAICFQFLPEGQPLLDTRIRAVPVVDSRLKPLDIVLLVSARRTLPTAAAIFVDQLSKTMGK